MQGFLRQKRIKTGDHGVEAVSTVSTEGRSGKRCINKFVHQDWSP